MRKSICLMGLAAFVLCASPGWSNPSDIVWTDDVANNPVIIEPGLTDANRAYYGMVIYDAFAEKWRAWFDASSGADLGYGESEGPAGTSWGGLTLCNGWEGSWKQSKAYIIQLGENSFRMWYMANDRAGGYEIYTALSSDGVTWSSDEWINGIAMPDPTQFGPTERFAAVQLEDGTFVSYVRCEESEIEEAGEGKRLYRYTSDDAVNWTWTNDTLLGDIEGYDAVEFSSVVKHPDLDGVWYAWGNNANSSGPFSSFVSVDDGLTFTPDEEVVATIGELGTDFYNIDRNYHPSATYLGDGNWVLFRTVAEPKGTAIATGKEQLATPVVEWSLQ